MTGPAPGPSPTPEPTSERSAGTTAAEDPGPGGAGAQLDWRRPHPFTVVAEIGRSLRSLIAAVVVIQGDVFGQGLITEVILAALPLAGALGRWWTTRYAVGAESLHHHYGLLWRNRQVLPRANIQNVSTRAGLVARLGSVVELQVSDASADGDVAIRYVTAAEADRLTALLRNPGRGLVGPVDGAPAAAPAAPPGETTSPSGPTSVPIGRRPLVQPSLAELLRAEATSLAALTPLPGVVLIPVVVLLALRALDGATHDGLPLTPIVYALLSALVPVAVTLAQVGTRMVQVGHFRLVADPDRLRIRVGLLTEARVTARRERVQQIRVVRELPHRRLGLERVEYETADVEVSDATATGYLTPVGPTGGWLALAEEVFGAVESSEDHLRPVSPLTRRRVLVRFGLVTMVVGVALAVVHPLAAPAVAAIGGGIGWWYSRARHRVLGWSLTEGQLLVRRGVLDQSLTLVRTTKIQSLRLRSTYFQRRLGLATLQVTTAGRGGHGLVTVPDLDTDTAEHLMTRLAHRSATTPIGDTL